MAVEREGREGGREGGKEGGRKGEREERGEGREGEREGREGGREKASDNAYMYKHAHVYSSDPKTLPYVSAGPDQTIILPQNTVILNGSASRDDFGITSYQWTRSNNSPAAGVSRVWV